MTKRNSTSPSDYIEPLDINGLQGRMMHLPAPKGKNTEILFVYGHHSSLERWWGLILVLNRYAAVTMPDLPGFGGMDSFYKINKKPTIDNLADYLAAFIKLRYKHKKIVIVGMSFGFVIATRMLQRYPELTKNVKLIVSLVGFAHHDDFTFSPVRYWFYCYISKVFAHRLPAAFFRTIVLNPRVLKLAYAHTHNAKHKFKLAKSKQEFNYLMEIEIGLWRDNEVRTYMYTSAQFLKLDNCQVRINLPVWHVSAQTDRFFDTQLVEQHMRTIFKDFHRVKSKLSTHAPSVIADEKMAASLIPKKMRNVLAKL